MNRFSFQSLLYFGTHAKRNHCELYIRHSITGYLKVSYLCIYYLFLYLQVMYVDLDTGHTYINLLRFGNNFKICVGI